MLIKIHKNRSVSSSGTWGTKNENNYEILNFEFPKELEEYNKRIVYYLGNQRVWDPIIDNKAILTNAITTKGSVKAYIWCTKSDEAFETDVDFRTQIFEMNFFENDNADGIVPTPEQVDGFNTMLTAMNNKIAEVNALETTIETAEAERQEAEATRVSNENTRETNESTRQTNEQTRQSQEADRERRTNEAISSIQDKTAEYNANAEEKTNEFNDLVETQKLVIENYADTQLNAIGKKGKQALSSITTTTQYALQNISLAQQTGVSAVETASSEATTNFNTNATNKTNAFNSNATEKTTAFDNNASSKTSDFNTNAESKTNTFNDNATEKTTAFNTNAQEKIDEYDEHIADYQAQIDELQEEVEELSENMPWNTTEQATEISVDDAAKYSRNKLELFGNTSQDSTTGKNLFDNSVERKNAYPGGDIGGQIAYVNSNATYSYVKCAYLEAGKTYTISWQQNIAPASENGRISRIIDENNINLASFISWLSNSNSISYTPNVSGYLVLATDINSTNIMIEEGSTATNYEPYTGGQPSPNPDYPQPIHVVTGNNTIKVVFNNQYTGLYKTGYLNNTGVYSYSSSGQKTIYAQVKPNTKYYIYKPLTTRCIVGGSDVELVNGATTTNVYRDDSATAFEYTTDSTANYLNIYCYAASGETISFEELQSKVIISEKPITNYAVNLGSLELCKIGNAQDYIYKENGNWYKYGAIDKYVYNDDLGPNALTENIIGFLTPALNLEGDLPMSNLGVISLCNMLKTTRVGNNNPRQNTGLSGTTSSGRIRIYMSTIYATTYAEGRQLCADNNLTIYFGAKVPVITQITDETLIAQLDAIYEHLKLVKGTNNITVTAEDLAPYMKLSYMQDLPSKLDNLDSRLALLE